MKIIKNGIFTGKQYLLWLVVSCVVTFLFFLYLRTFYLTPGVDFGIDVYYHVKAGDMFPFIATTKQFPWTEMSIWKTCFYDKELGFHFIIYLLRGISHICSFSPDPPFHFICIVLTLMFLVTVAIGGYHFCRTTCIIIPPLLFFITPTFFFKLVMIRPAILSMIFFLILLYVLMSDKSTKTKNVLVFIIGWLYTICCSFPQIMLVAIFAYIATQIICEKKFVYSYLHLLMSAISGILAGLTLHPQFPNTYVLWYIQGVDVLMKILGFGRHNVLLGEELNPPTLRIIFQNTLMFALFFANIVMFRLNKKKSFNTIFLFLVQTITMVGFFFSQRCIEFFLPSGVLYFAFALNNYNIHLLKNKTSHLIPKNIKILTPVVLLILFVMIPVNQNYIKHTLQLPPCYDFVDWAKVNLKPGTYIGLLNWGDFPRLFYLTREFTYTSALDPMFSYYAYPERTSRIEMFRDNRLQLTPLELSKALGTNLLYATKCDHIAIMNLIDNGAQILSSDKEGCLLGL